MAALSLVGWLGNALFFSRSLSQWVSSERARQCVVPRAFWQLSAAGTLCTAVYAAGRAEPVLLAGAAVNAVVYARNLALQRSPDSRLPPARVATALAGAAAGLLVLVGIRTAAGSAGEPPPWVVTVVVGQALWSSRFALQWWYAEREGKSVLPCGFWWVSLVGNTLLLAYAAHRADPVFIAGFAPGPLLQARNLLFLRGGGARSPRPRPRSANRRLLAHEPLQEGRSGRQLVSDEGADARGQLG